MRGLKLELFKVLASLLDVARSTRAWIETLNSIIKPPLQLSHALRVRGLKRSRPGRKYSRLPVARSTRAWIETSSGTGTPL